MKEYRIKLRVESYEEYFVDAENEEEALKKFNDGDYSDGFHHQESIPLDEPEVEEA